MNQGIATAIFSNLLGASVSFDSSTRASSSAAASSPSVDNCAVVFEQIYKKTSQDFKKQILLRAKLLELHESQDFFLVKMFTNETAMIPFDESFTIDEVKTLIEELKGIKFDQQRLIFEGKRLETDKTLAYYNIGRGSMIHLVLCLRGGGGFSLQVRTYDGKEIDCHLSDQATVNDVKRCIKGIRGIPISRQILIFQSKELANSRKIKDVRENSGCVNDTNNTIYLVLKEDENVNRILGPHILDPPYDFDFTNINDNDKSFSRGGREYKRPCGWQRIALKVKDKYGDNSWLGSNNSTGEWPVAYHGTNFDGIHGISFNGFDKTKWKREWYGKAHYTTPAIDVAEEYACLVNYGGQAVKFVLQCRINPAKLQIVNSGKYWLLPDDQDVRPYGICFKFI